MMSPQQRWTLAVFFAIAAAGFLVPFWPLSVLGIVLIVLSGHWFVGLVVGILLDLASGTPVGPVQHLYFPFTILAVVLALARWWAAGYFIDRSPGDTL